MHIAIDGPSGAGKSTLARAIAEHYHIVYVDTGALYRSIALYVLERNLDPHDTSAVIASLDDIRLDLRFENGEQHVLLCGEDVGAKIRTPQVSAGASAVSAIPEVRAFLLETQRSIVRKNSVVMDGRDIGTVIIPDADVKIFLVASNEARARRRVAELREKGMNVSYDEILQAMIERDQNDRTRATAPAVAAPDAIMLDNSEWTLEETIRQVISIIDEKVN